MAAEIMLKVKCSKRWFFWPLFFAIKAAYMMRIISLKRAADISAKGIHLEVGK